MIPIKLQYRNASLSITSSLGERTTYFNFQQPLNIDLRIWFTEEGSFVPLRERHPLNASIPIFLSTSEKMTSSNVAQARNSPANSSTEENIVILFKEEQPWNASVPFVTKQSRRSTCSNSVHWANAILQICQTVEVEGNCIHRSEAQFMNTA